MLSTIIEIDTHSLGVHVELLRISRLLTRFVHQGFNQYQSNIQHVLGVDNGVPFCGILLEIFKLICSGTSSLFLLFQLNKLQYTFQLGTSVTLFKDSTLYVVRPTFPVHCIYERQTCMLTASLAIWFQCCALQRTGICYEVFCFP